MFLPSPLKSYVWKPKSGLKWLCLPPGATKTYSFSTWHEAYTFGLQAATESPLLARRAAAQ